MLQLPSFAFYAPPWPNSQRRSLLKNGFNRALFNGFEPSAAIEGLQGLEHLKIGTVGAAFCIDERYANTSGRK
jgi:hypothetical protein